MCACVCAWFLCEIDIVTERELYGHIVREKLTDRERERERESERKRERESERARERER